MSIVVNIAEAVKDLLNAGSFSMPFTAERYAAVRSKLKDTRVLRVSVVPRAFEYANVSRGQTSREVGVYVVIQKSIGHESDAPDNDDVDPLLAFTEEVVEYLSADARSVLTIEGGAAQFVRIEADPLYDADALYTLNQFTATPVAIYRVHQ